MPCATKPSNQSINKHGTGRDVRHMSHIVYPDPPTVLGAENNIA